MGYRAFTVEEANALIPHLEEVLEGLREGREEMERQSEKLQLLDVLWGSKLLDPDNPDHPEFLRRRKRIRELVEEMEETIVDEILDRGIRFPSGGLEHGLLDFPTTYEGRWVYLCWKLGEPEVKQWHEVESGFQGRRDLTDEERSVMGKVDDPADMDDSVLDF